MTAPSSWLPNLVGGVSIWKLAVDLNEARFFDGRLLVPETEGSDRLPASVTWNVQGMIPLAEARAQFPEQTAAAIRDFAACVEKVRAELGDPDSGYKKYKDAFSVPALDAAASEANYYYSPATQKLFVTNWGASPRSIAGQGKLVFGYDAFGSFVEHAQKEAPAIAAPIAPVAEAPGVAAVAGVVAAGGVVEAPAAPPPDDPKKPEEKKKDDDEKNRPWWIWLLLILALGLLIALILFLLRSCEQHRIDAGDAGANADAAGLDGSALDGAANGQMQGASDSGTNSGSKDAGQMADGGRDGGPDGGDGGGLGGAANSVGAGSGTGFLADGGVLILDGHGLGIGLGAGQGSGSGSGSGQGGSSELAHRTHTEPSALKWRVVSGKDALDPGSPTEGEGQSFDIALKPGHSGEGVKVQWQGGDGKWHNF